MNKPQITVRISSSLLDDLNQYVESTGSSKTDVVVTAIAQYLGSVDRISMDRRIADLERKVSKLEFQISGETLDV